MKSYNIAGAARNLSKIVADVERGETVTLSRRGVPVATLAPHEPAVRPLTAFCANTQALSSPFAFEPGARGSERRFSKCAKRYKIGSLREKLGKAPDFTEPMSEEELFLWEGL